MPVETLESQTVPIEGKKLGRVAPVQQYDVGDFKYVVTHTGNKHVYPRLSKHFRTRHEAGMKAIPPGPYLRGDKAKEILAEILRNNVLGCCVISSRNHKNGIQLANDTGTIVLTKDAEIDADYKAACGPGDNGCSMSDVNQYEMKTGMMMSGKRHKIDAAVAVDWTNKELVRAAIYYFGTINVGMNLPNGWYQSGDGADWGPVTGGAGRIVGGHEVQAYDCDDLGVWIATWGGKRRILWTAFTSRVWIDECYTSLGEDWYGSDKIAPGGFDVTSLLNAINQIKNGQVPDISPPTPPSPPIPPVPPVPPVPISKDLHGYGTMPPFTIHIPAGMGAKNVSVTPPQVAVTIPANQHNADGGNDAELDGGNKGALPWLKIFLLLGTVIPIVMTDFQQGKSIEQIIQDVLIAIGGSLAKLGLNPSQRLEAVRNLVETALHVLHLR